MLAFLFGISVTFNIICIILIISFIKIKSDRDFFNSDFIVDKEQAKSFLSDDKK